MPTPYLNIHIPITDEQALEIMATRSNGYAKIIDPLEKIELEGESCLEELDGLVVHCRSLIGDKAKFPKWPTVNAAQGCYGWLLDNNRIDGVSTSKGGQVWTHGYFSLTEIEHLCVYMRWATSNGSRIQAQGALATMAENAVDRFLERYKTDVSYGPDYTLSDIVMEMWASGINPAVFLGLYERYVESVLKGFTLPKIVSAATQYFSGNGEAIIIPSPRHGGVILYTIVTQLRIAGVIDDDKHAVQGFIDQHDRFWTRAEAYHICLFNDIKLREQNGWPEGLLCSEQLY